ncbi:MAG: branched-chain amino acid transaminase [Flavobacteriales bacterium]|nr:branched-chain amino acid transaminase [Flavobacteriales bacterium]
MYYNDNTTVYLNGEWLKAASAKTDLYSQTLHYGCGVFEGIRSYKTEDDVRVFKAEEHYDRLLFSAKKMHLNFDYPVDKLVTLTYELLERNNLKDAYIRPLVYVDAYMHLTPAKTTNLFLCAWEWDNLFKNRVLDVMTSSFRRPHPKSCFVDAKITGHYTNSLLATTEAKSMGSDEALLLDTNGNVAEGPGANFFYQKNDILYTCPLGNVLPGITRATVFGLAKELGFEVQQKFFTPDDVKGADGAFFTGTAAEVTGIKSLDKVPFLLDWEDSMGYELSRMYQHKVAHNEYGEFALV